MADRGRPLPIFLIRELRARHALGFSIRAISRTMGLSRVTVRKYLPCPAPPVRRAA